MSDEIRNNAKLIMQNIPTYCSRIFSRDMLFATDFDIIR